MSSISDRQWLVCQCCSVTGCRCSQQRNHRRNGLVVSDTHIHTHTLNGPFSGTIQVSRYQKGKTSNLDFTEARESEWQWHQLGHMQVCASLQTDNHASTSLLSFLQAFCRPTNSVKALNSSSVSYMWVKSYSRNKVVQRLRLRIN